MIVDFCVRNGMAAMNTFFQHREQHRWTWYRWNHGQGRYTERSEIDFFLTGDKRKVRDVKSISSESMDADHRLVVEKLLLNKPKRERIVKHKRIKVEELKNKELKDEYQQKIGDRLREAREVGGEEVQNL